MNVLVTSRSFGPDLEQPRRILEDAGLTIVRGDLNHDLDALGESLSSASAWIAGVAPVTDAHLQIAPRLKIIARYGVGVDAIDLRACQARGIIVTNTPGANTEAVADQTLALMLAALRHVVDSVNAVRAGSWSARRGRELGALTVGIAGFGRIGRAVARRVSAFGARVIAFDPFLAPQAMLEAQVEPIATFEALLEMADVISLHLPGGRVVLDEAALEQVKPGALIVNTARGDLLDEAATVRALESGRLGAVAVDVLFDERSHSSPLIHAPNAIVTPHASAQTFESVNRMGCMAADEVVRVLHNQQPVNRVV